MDKALLITLIGMSLVFAAIILLWALMVVVTRLLPAQAEDSASEGDDSAEMSSTSSDDDHLLRQQAAAIAVATALALQNNDSENGLPRFPLPPTALVSAWQAVTRSKQIQPRSPRGRD